MEKVGDKRDADSSVGGGDPPGAKVGKTDAQHVWVKVKGGGAVLYDADDLKNVSCVSKLLEKVKDKEQPKLDAVALGELKLYKCEADAAHIDKAFRPGKLVSEIDGGKDDENALYVDYPEAQAASSGKKRAMELDAETIGEIVARKLARGAVTPSDSQAGKTPGTIVKEILRNIEVIVVEAAPGGSAAFGDDLATLQAARSEHHFDVLFTPHLQKLCRSTESIVNSEHYQWNWEQGGKPDFFRCLSGCFQKLPTPKYSADVAEARAAIEAVSGPHHFGIPHGSILELTAVFESKLHAKDADLAQLWGYLLWLPDGISKGMLFDPHHFTCLEAAGMKNNKVVSQCIQGKWSTPGSWDVVQQFFDRRGRLEALVHACCVEAKATLQGFLGRGGSGWVFEVDVPDRGRVAMKIVDTAEKVAKADVEILALNAAAAMACSVVQPLAKKASRVTNGAFYLMSPSGKPADVAWVRTHAKSVFRSLRRLHEAGFVHGDARLQNLIIDTNTDTPLWADFMGVTSFVTDPGRADDIRAFSLSMGAGPTLLASITASSLDEEKFCHFVLRFGSEMCRVHGK